MGSEMCIRDSLRIEAGALSDTAGNPSDSRTRQATELIPDTTRPTLDSFDFDLDAGVMTLHFDEAVDLSTFVLNELVIDEGIDDDPAFSPTSSTYAYVTDSLRDIEVTFTREELNEIKRIQVCSDNTTCFLYFPRTVMPGVTPIDIISDIAGNGVEIINFLQARSVSNFTADTTPPRLERFTDFDLDSGRFSIRFDETVNTTSVDLTELTFTDWYAMNSPQLNTVPFPITGGTVLSGIGCLLYTSPSPRDATLSRMPSSA